MLDMGFLLTSGGFFGRLTKPDAAVQLTMPPPIVELTRDMPRDP
jgi:hypothetical protein